MVSLISQTDKQKHILAGFIISLMFVWISPLLAIMIVAFVGISKEFYDSTGKGCVEGWDVAATVLGGFPVCILVEAYNQLFC